MLDRLIKKAEQSNCKFRVAAMALDKKGNLIGLSRNTRRFPRRGGGIHAEMALMAQYGKNIHTIIICRIGRGGDLRPLEACAKCQAKANELGITIRTVL